ncbi:MAG: hypothetical protein Q8Q49_01760 [bacterium]|nr:hypothetical protein [bacterium]
MKKGELYHVVSVQSIGVVAVLKGKMKKTFHALSVIELLLYMGLLSIFLAILSQLFIASLQVQLESESISSVEQDGRFLLSRFHYDIVQASAVQSPGTYGEEVDELVITVDGNTIRYFLSGTDLMVTTDGSTEKLSGADVLISDLGFTKFGNVSGKPTVWLSFTVTSKIQRTKGADSKTFSATYGLR